MISLVFKEGFRAFLSDDCGIFVIFVSKIVKFMLFGVTEK